MGIYSIGHLTERCKRWMACYSQTFTETFCAIKFVCCGVDIYKKNLKRIKKSGPRLYFNTFLRLKVFVRACAITSM